MTRKILAIAAMDEGRVIGNEGQIPWQISEDMQRFKQLTTGHAVLMGRKTYQSLPLRFRPLPGRINFVVTRTPESLKGESGIQIFSSPQECIKQFLRGDLAGTTEQLWIIGGAEIYAETLPFWDEVYLTLVLGRNKGDAFFPEFESRFSLRDEQLRQGYKFLHYAKND